jgi:hypothetical protein
VVDHAALRCVQRQVCRPHLSIPLWGRGETRPGDKDGDGA